MREHVPHHYVITNGGRAPNVVPETAEVFYYVRHPQAAELFRIWDRVEAAARGAAAGTGTEVAIETTHGSHSLLPNPVLVEIADNALRGLGGLTYDESDRAFAEQIYAGFERPDLPLGSHAEVQEPPRGLWSASTDVGDVSWNVPTVQLQIATWVPGTAPHTWQAVAAGGMEIGAQGMELAAKAMALTAAELLTDAALMESVREAFDEARGPGFVYQSLLGDRAPPLDYRR